MPVVTGYMTDKESEMLPFNEVIFIIHTKLALLELKVVFFIHALGLLFSKYKTLIYAVYLVRVVYEHCPSQG